MRERDGAFHVCPRFEISATPIGVPLLETPPILALGHVAGLRVAHLHHETRNDPVKTQSVVEPLVHELDDVRHRLRRLVGIGLELERALLGFDDDDRPCAG